MKFIVLFAFLASGTASAIWGLETCDYTTKRSSQNVRIAIQSYSSSVFSCEQFEIDDNGTETLTFRQDPNVSGHWRLECVFPHNISLTVKNKMDLSTTYVLDGYDRMPREDLNCYKDY